MNEPLDLHNLAAPALISRMVWLGSLTGLRWGASLGATYAFLYGLGTQGILVAMSMLVVGAWFGAAYGLGLGSLHGLILGLITTFYFCPVGDERIYRRSLAATSLLLNTGVGLLLESYYLAFESELSTLLFGWPLLIAPIVDFISERSLSMLLFGWPLLIATIAGFIGSQRLAQLCISERFRLAATFLDDQTKELVLLSSRS